MPYPGAFFLYAVNPATAPEREILPQVVSTSLTTLVDEDIHITEIVLTNQGDVQATVTVQDRQATPLPLLAAVPIDAHGTYGLPFRGRLMRGGVDIISNTANAVIASVRGF